MKASEELFSARILATALSMILIALVIFMYNEVVPDLLVEAEQFLAASMGKMDGTVAAR